MAKSRDRRTPDRKRVSAPRAGASRRGSARPTWTGTLKLRLIAIPIRVFPATDPKADIAFRQLHRVCQTPIQMKWWCPQCDREVSRDEIVKGHEYARGKFVLFEEEELAAVRPESTRLVELGHVMPRTEIDPVLIERSYYIAPDNAAAGEPFAVIRDALGDRAGIGRLALYGREYLVAVTPRNEGLLMQTLRRPPEVRSMGAISELEFAEVDVRSDEIALARQLLDSLETDKSLSDYVDEYRETLATLIEKKVAGEEVVEPELPAAAPANVVNLMDALRKSLERSEGATARRARRPARAAGQRARKRAS